MATPTVVSKNKAGKYEEFNTAPAARLQPQTLWSNLAKTSIPKRQRKRALETAFGPGPIVKRLNTNDVFRVPPAAGNVNVLVVNGAAAELMVSSDKCTVDVHTAPEDLKTPQITLYHPGGTETEVRRSAELKCPIVACRVTNVKKRHLKAAQLNLRCHNQRPLPIVTAIASDMIGPTVISTATRLVSPEHARARPRALLMPYHTIESKYVCPTCRRLFSTAEELAKHDNWTIDANPAVVRLYPSGHMAPFKPNAKARKPSKNDEWKAGALQHIEEGRPEDAAKLAPTLIRKGAAAALQSRLSAIPGAVIVP